MTKKTKKNTTVEKKIILAGGMEITYIKQSQQNKQASHVLAFVSSV